MLNLQTIFRTAESGGTLGSNDLMRNPAVPRSSQGMGAQGADDRAYTRSVNPNELVSNQLNNLLANDSRYINQSRAEAQRLAASRGLGNSSIAAGAGVRAAIQAGLPIAQQDAGTYSSAAAQNVDALNQNLMQQRQIENEQVARGLEAMAGVAGARGSGEVARAEAEARNRLQLQLQRERLAFEGEQAALGREFDLGRMGYEFNLRDMFSNNDLGRDLTRMGADYQWRDNFANNDTARQDWLNSNNFNREFYGTMQTLFANSQINSTSDMFNMLNSYALNNPDIFNAGNYTTFANYASNAMASAMGNIFSRIFGPTGG